MADPSLARQAGRFVWLELDFDNPENKTFIERHAVAYTPSLFVIDPADQRASAAHLGGMTLDELGQFLDRGERGVTQRAKEPADAAMSRGDDLVGRGLMPDAAAAYREALRLAGPVWPQRPRAVRSLAWALLAGGQPQACAELSAAEAPAMPRDATFASVVLGGLSCANQGGGAAWAATSRKIVEPLAVEAAALPSTLRDDRFQIYQQLMHASIMRGDAAALARWGRRWLDEIGATHPADDDERTALDIARVDAVSLLGRPELAMPALVASEQAMPANYNASLRLAQLATAAKAWDDALAACERGLAHVTGPIGRTWLLETRAEALIGKGDAAGARSTLEEALRSAAAIGPRSIRENNIRRINAAIAEAGKAAP